MTDLCQQNETLANMIKFPNSGNKKELMLWVSETYRNVSMEVALNLLCYFDMLVENDAGTAETNGVWLCVRPKRGRRHQAGR